MKINKNVKLKSAVTLAVSVAGLLGGSGHLQALQFQYGDFELDVDTTVGYAAQWRVQSQDDEILDHLKGGNRDDGNRNFDPGLVSSRASALLELAGHYNSWSFLMRGNAFFDEVYQNGKTDMEDFGYQTYNDGMVRGGDVKIGNASEDTRDKHGADYKLLDAFVHNSFELGNQTGSFNLGRQVISWGESTFFPGVNGLQNPADAVAALAPGTEVKEILLPAGAAYFQMAVNDSLTAELYYQYEWESTELPGVGSYFSTSDITGPGAERLLFSSVNVPKTTTDKPADDGQWGAAARYVTEQGNEIALFYVNSHARTPLVIVEGDIGSIFAGDGSYHQVYADNISAYAASLSTNVGEASVLVDMMYSPDYVFTQTNNIGLPSAVAVGHYFQTSVSYTDTYGQQNPFADQVVILAELLYSRNNLGYNNLSEGSSGESPYLVSDEAWAYALRLMFNYSSVLPGLDIEIPLYFRHDVSGDASGVNQVYDNSRQFSAGIDGFYLNNWKFNLSYATFFGGKENNRVNDRDNVAISLKYTF